MNTRTGLAPSSLPVHLMLDFYSEFTIYLVIYLLQVGKIWNSLLINTNSNLLDLIPQILQEPGGNCVMRITDRF